MLTSTNYLIYTTQSLNTYTHKYYIHHYIHSHAYTIYIFVLYQPSGSTSASPDMLVYTPYSLVVSIAHTPQNIQYIYNIIQHITSYLPYIPTQYIEYNTYYTPYTTIYTFNIP